MKSKRKPDAEHGASAVKPERGRVFLVDDHALLRKGIEALIASTDDLTVCGEAADAADTLRLLPESQADIAVVDISLPGNSGIDLIRDLQTLKPGFPIVVLSMHDETLYGERSLRAGARGYVMKQDAPDRLLEAIRTVLAGHVFVGENLKDTLLSAIIVTTNDHKKFGVERLSNRELQVFESIGRGMSTAEIATQLSLSPKTVETYRAHIKRKLGLKDGNHLLQAAIRWEEAEYSGV